MSVAADDEARNRCRAVIRAFHANITTEARPRCTTAVTVRGVAVEQLIVGQGIGDRPKESVRSVSLRMGRSSDACDLGTLDDFHEHWK